VALWCLDEYWHFAIFTLLMLLLFEATVVKSRLKNMTSLRQMAQRSPQSIYVYRKRTWKLVPASDLLPGDLCSLVRSSANAEGAASSGEQKVEGGMICPADMLLLAGGLVANEAMLTGESTPHHKEAASARTRTHAEIEVGTDAPLDMRYDRLHIVFGGTQIMQHTPSPYRFHGVPPSPDKGCIAYVLRTGFDTSQGRLMRTILFSSERVTADTLESLVFILFLLVFAIAAAAYVMNEGLKDATRSRLISFLFSSIPLFLYFSPPSLPLSLSLSLIFVILFFLISPVLYFNLLICLQVQVVTQLYSHHYFRCTS
jgi:manganese-transporting P-type ATPase